MVAGFRAFTDGFSVVILDGTQEKPVVVLHQRYIFPAGHDCGRALGWARKQVLELLGGHSVSKACVKTIEPVAQQKSAVRIQVEGVIVESLFTAAGIECGLRIKAQLKRAIPAFTEPARYLERVLSNVEELQVLNKTPFIEATLAAISVLPSK